MNLKELDSKLIKLAKEQQQINVECGEIESEIEELSIRKDCLESRQEGIEEEIKTIKKQMLNEATFSDENKFMEDFIKASWFCDQCEVRPAIQYVKITKDRLIALDGYRAIMIKTDVPQGLENTFIKWDVRENFKEHIEKIKFPDIKEVFEEAEKNDHIYFDVTVEDFYKKFNAKKNMTLYNDSWLIRCGDIEICFNKEYMNSALMAFKGSKFTLKIGGELKPILLENESMKIIVLPIKPIIWKN